MKLFTAIFVIAGLFGGNATAQTDTNDPDQLVSTSAPDQIDQMSIDACRASLRQCLADISAQAAGNTELLNELAQRMGFASADEMLAADCRSRRGTWSNGECLCASPSSWYTAETEECCVENARGYGRRQESCLDSGGTYSCRGGCRCPMGTQLLDGQCQGEAATRQEVTDLRIVRDERVPALESQIADLERQLEAAREAGEDQAEWIAALESQLAAAQRELEFLRGILASRNIDVPDQTEEDPLSVPPDVIAAAVGSSTDNPVTGVQPPAESEETWCEANPGWCTVVILGSGVAAAGLGLGICAAAGCFESDDIEASWGYNR